MFTYIQQLNWKRDSLVAVRDEIYLRVKELDQQIYLINVLLSEMEESERIE